jgi:hypothetical protein
MRAIGVRLSLWASSHQPRPLSPTSDILSPQENRSMQLFAKLSRSALGGKPNRASIGLAWNGGSRSEGARVAAAQRSIMREGSGPGASCAQIGSLTSML